MEKNRDFTNRTLIHNTSSAENGPIRAIYVENDGLIVVANDWLISILRNGTLHNVFNVSSLFDNGM